MRSISLFSLPILLVLLLGAACARQQYAQRLEPAVGRQITTENEAIAVVLEEIERRGDDPERYECNARPSEKGWMVVAWRIIYPENVGASRFVPGGFTSYLVSPEGEILMRRPGN